MARQCLSDVNLRRVQRIRKSQLSQVLGKSIQSKGNSIHKHSEAEKFLQIQETERGSHMWPENRENHGM